MISAGDAAGRTGDFESAQREARLQQLLAPRRRSFVQRNDTWLISVVSLAIVFGIWEGIVQAGLVRPSVLAGPSQIIRTLLREIQTGLLWRDLSYSGFNFVIGFSIAALLGIPLGLLMGTKRLLEKIFTPYVMGINAIPRLAFVTLLIVWFGLGIEGKIFLIVLSAFFPIVINTWAGVRVVDPILLRAGRAYGARGWQLFLRVIIPYTIPFIMAGLRQGVGRALIGVVGSELYGTDVGLGYRIISSGLQFKPDGVFAGVVLLAIFGVVSNELIEYAERRIAPWRQTHH